MNVQLWPFLALNLFILSTHAHELDHEHNEHIHVEEGAEIFIEDTTTNVFLEEPLISDDDNLNINNSDEMTEVFEINERGAIYDSKTGKRRYDDYQLLRVNPQTDEHLDVLQFLDKAKGMVEMWSPIPYNASLVDRVDMLVSPKHVNHVRNYLNCSGMDSNILEDNLQKAIDSENDIDENAEIIWTRDSNPTTLFLAQQRPKRGTTFGDFLRGLFIDHEPPEAVRDGRNSNPNPPTGKCTKTGMNWQQYHRYNTINNFVQCLASEYPDKATLYNIGKSYEGRDLHLLKITNNNRLAKSSIWIDGGIHAREWASPSSVTFMMQEFLENSNKYQHILDKHNIYILPLANPDGYEYSHIKDRLWRKTRSNHLKSRCVGVDPNRNWGYNWGGQGASGDPCDETYYGPRPFSEPETAAIRNFIMARKDTMELYLTFHTYGQYVLYPWGYARQDAIDKNDLHRMGKIGASAAKRVSGHKYSVGSAAKMLYPAAGGSDDWAKGGAGIKYSYTIELPDTGRHGFLLPARQAQKVGREAVALTEAMISAI